MELHYKLNAKIFLLALFGVIMVISSYFTFVYEPVQLVIKKMLSLSPGSLFFYIWSSPPYKVYINLYMFNVTNHEKFMRGEEKMNVQEVGPYCYQEIIVNTNATFHPNGTVSFIPVRYLKFLPDLSIGDPNIDRVISPNIPLLGITSMLKNSSMFTNIALTAISNTANAKPFLNITVHEYFFGYDDRLVTLAHTALPTWINFERFGIFDRVMALDNSSNVETMTIDYTKAQPSNPLYDSSDTNRDFYIQLFNGSPGLQQWGYEDIEDEYVMSPKNSRCNFVGGAFDGTLFPRSLTMNDSFYLYRRAFCRPIPMRPVRELLEDGYEAIEYTMREDFLAPPSVNPENQCYCKDGGDCLPNGLVSIAPCYYGIPITISRPHFYDSDPVLTEKVTGLAPDKEKHGESLILHKALGAPLRANLRVQVNLDVGCTKWNAKTILFNNLHIPLCWLELKVDEVPFLVHVAAMVSYEIGPILEVILKYTLGIFGALMISWSALILLQTSEIIEATTPLDTLPFSKFSLRRSSEYKPLPVINIPYEYSTQNTKISK